MNHIYRSLWNAKTGTFVAVSEIVTSGKKASTGGGVVGGVFALKALAVSLLLGFGSTSYALPVGGVVAAGSAAVTTGTGGMTVNQSSQNAVLNWQSFNIGQGEAVRFVQPNSSSVALNRVIGADPSSILGSLTANGKVFLVNPNGILFGAGASVNVGGLVASTRNISDSDFMAGNYRFAGSGSGAVVNQGSIHADGGYVALLGANVSNQGVIAARLGTVALAAGNAVTLDVAGDGLLNVTVDQGAVNALVQNGGMLQADGGQVLMTAQAAGNLLQTVVNNTGVIQAQTIENHNGVIKLVGDMQSGTVNVGGTLDASAPNGGNGGFIETSAAHVKVNDTARITTSAPQGLTGSWLIDPADFTIAATGGDMTGAALSTSLGTTDVTIYSTSGSTGTAGDVNVNDVVSWSSHKLTLNAQNNININANLNGSGTASLALEFGQGAVAAGNTSNVITHNGASVNLPASTSNFTTRQGSDGLVKAYTVITSLGAAGSTTATDLQGIGSGASTLNFALGADIDASATSGWNAGAGFLPDAPNFTGTFDGLGHIISNLTINRPSTSRVGLFEKIGTGGVVRNVGLVGGSVTGNSMVGGLVGENAYGTISNSYATGTVNGSGYTGGLVGNNYGGAISNSYATGAVNGGSYTGGLVGNNNYGGSTISNSYASGAVSGGSSSGGLAGRSNGTVSNSYASGAVSSTGSSVGGLIGYNASTISNSYASGAVSGSSSVGGLVGFNNGTVTASFWDTETSGQTTSAGGTGLTTAALIAALPTGFATGVWGNGDNQTTPYLLGMTGNQVFNANDLPSGTISATNRPNLYTVILNVDQLQAVNTSLAGRYVLGNDIDASATASWNAGAGFAYIGTPGTQFTGTFDGLNHTISGITINQPSLSYVGLFGATGAASTISNVGLLNGSVIGSSYIGGLVGRNGGAINNSYATIDVSGSAYVGGLVGYMIAGGTIDNSYAAGDVAAVRAGGLVGRNEGVITNSYASGAATGSYAGGLLGLNAGTVINSFWDTTTSGQSASAGGVGMTTADMQTQANFTSATAANGNVNPAWDMANTWIVYDGHTSPLLRSFMTALTVTANSATKTYDGLGTTGGNGVTYSTTPNGNLLGTVSYSSGINVGSATITPGGLYSNQQGYLISYVDGALMVNKADLTLSGTRTYDGSSAVAGSVLTATGVAGETFAVTGTGDTTNLASKNVQTGSALANITGLALGTSSNGGLSGNYNALSKTGSSVSITKANLTVATSNVTKTYDGTLAASGTATVTSGTLFDTDALSGGTFAFTDPNAGSNKTVTTVGVAVADGNGGGNYNVTYADNTASTITRKALTVAGETALDKVYDGTTLATLSGGTLTGLISGDTVSLIEAGTFATPDAGNGIAVAAAVSLGGSSAGNYSVIQPTGLTANITAPVSVVDSGPRSQDAIVSAVSLMSTVALQSTRVDAPATITTGDALPSIQSSIGSTPGGLAGLNISITGNGVKLPPGVQRREARDDKD
ncbi:beta strand repeat-containing protein [Thiobacillus sp.]